MLVGLNNPRDCIESCVCKWAIVGEGPSFPGLTALVSFLVVRAICAFSLSGRSVRFLISKGFSLKNVISDLWYLPFRQALGRVVFIRIGAHRLLALFVLASVVNQADPSWLPARHRDPRGSLRSYTFKLVALRLCFFLGETLCAGFDDSALFSFCSRIIFVSLDQRLSGSAWAAGFYLVNTGAYFIYFADEKLDVEQVLLPGFISK